MTSSTNEAKLNEISQLDPEQRFKYLTKQAVEQQQIWILTDEHGSVMLTTDDEDCIPIWPSQAFAQMWATGDWQGFEAKAIELSTWLKRWTPGLMDDELSVVVFPLTEEDGLVIDPDELDFALTEQMKKRRSN